MVVVAFVVVVMFHSGTQGGGEIGKDLRHTCKRERQTTIAIVTSVIILHLIQRSNQGEIKPSTTPASLAAIKNNIQRTTGTFAPFS
jgi:preprotein translocase subunit SecG